MFTFPGLRGWRGRRCRTRCGVFTFPGLRGIFLCQLVLVRLAHLLPVDLGRNASSGFAMGFWLWLMRSVAAPPFRRKVSKTPLATLVVLVVKVPPRTSLLTRNALRDPRVIVRVRALTYFTCVLPIVTCTCVLAPRASGVLAVSGSGVRSMR